MNFFDIILLLWTIGLIITVIGIVITVSLDYSSESKFVKWWKNNVCAPDPNNKET